jgi:hypothetical protein
MPKLDLSNAALIDKESAQKHKSAFDLIAETKQKMEEMGLEDYPQPNSRPTPLAEIENIDGLTNSQLGGLYVEYVAYAQFVGARLAELVATYKIAVNNVKHITAELTASLYAKDVPKGEISTRVRESVAFQEADAELVKIFAMKTLLEAHHRAYDKQAAALSRLISLRELEFQQTIRQDNVGTRTKGTKAKWTTFGVDLRKVGE